MQVWQLVADENRQVEHGEVQESQFLLVVLANVPDGQFESTWQLFSWKKKVA